jgi:TIR domain
MAGADSGAGPGGWPRWQWDVALSFAGAQRDYVQQVAQVLQARGVRCFYDAGEQIELCGKYLAEELPVIYGEQAAAVVVFVSAEYAARDWTPGELPGLPGGGVEGVRDLEAEPVHDVGFARTPRRWRGSRRARLWG